MLSYRSVDIRKSLQLEELLQVRRTACSPGSVHQISSFHPTSFYDFQSPMCKQRQSSVRGGSNFAMSPSSCCLEPTWGVVCNALIARIFSNMKTIPLHLIERLYESISQLECICSSRNNWKCQLVPLFVSDQWEDRNTSDKGIVTRYIVCVGLLPWQCR